jgi:outer membrane lipoprotein
MRLVSLLILLFLLASCASAPTFDTAGVDRSLTPQRTSTSPQSTTGKNVQWGGTIVRTTNLKDSTQIEVLAFPLDTDGRPRVDATAQGRFILERAGYLEPADYAPGRQVTTVGTVTGTLAGKVGEADYTYPAIRARQLYLWAPERSYGGGSSFFGFGVGGGGGGGWGSGVGVGIGF